MPNWRECLSPDQSSLVPRAIGGQHQSLHGWLDRDLVSRYRPVWRRLAGVWWEDAQWHQRVVQEVSSRSSIEKIWLASTLTLRTKQVRLVSTSFTS
jgi:hypothetical protein